MSSVSVAASGIMFASDPPCYDDGVLILGQYCDADVAAHLAGEDEETARRFGWWPHVSTEATVTAAYRTWEHDWATDGLTRTFAVRNQNGALLGGCQLQRHDGSPWTVSYWTGAAQRGRGIATRALKLLLRHADREGITALECYVAVDNTASRRVAEAAGFTNPTRTTERSGHDMVRYTMRRPAHDVA